MMVAQKLIIGVLSLLLFSTQAYGKDFYRYFGLGTSTGTYDEKKFDLYSDIDSTSYVYGNFFAPKNDLLSTTLFAQLTQFELDVRDSEQRRHDLDVMLIGLNWAKGLAGKMDVGDNNIILDASLFVGTGLIRASKKVTNANGSLHSDYPQAFGLDFGYGSMLSFVFVADGTWTLGVRQIFQSNNVYLNFDGDSATLIQDVTTEFFLGYAGEPSPACVETKYSPCI
jgi:hypothetical protein